MSETKTDEELAREWMASDNWGVWRKGMISNYGWLCMQDGEPPASGQEFIPTGYPDLDHPGTRAFLLEDVRRAWGEPGLSASGWWAAYMDAPDDDSEKGEQWGVILESGDCAYGATEQDALIAALLAAPEKTK